MSECIAVNIQDMLKAIGGEELQSLLSDFSSPLNEETEDSPDLKGKRRDKNLYQRKKW